MKPKTKFALIGVLSALFTPFLLAEAGSADKAKDADNSAHNERDRNNASATPLAQGKSASDVATTKQIREQVVADKGLSTNAHNVKIITQNGHVTLRGPVKNAAEKQMIGEIAGKVATAENVDNQLEVKASTSADGM